MLADNGKALRSRCRCLLITGTAASTYDLVRERRNRFSLAAMKSSSPAADDELGSDSDSESFRFMVSASPLSCSGRQVKLFLSPLPQHNAMSVLLQYCIFSNSKLDLCEGGSFSPTVFKCYIKLSFYHISCFVSVCPFVPLSKAKFADNLQIVLSSPY